MSIAAGMLLPATSATANSTRSSFRGLAWTHEHIVVVTGDCVGRSRLESNLDAWNGWGLVGQQPVLNFARDFQIALHDHAVAYLENQYQQ
ncbi:MAG TPA: hypothetical protein VLL05_22535 [Terriglobales bacterium]|nr:hypothetical protein [Terriglobales bacterium]